jgi:hypothetical protein
MDDDKQRRDDLKVLEDLNMQFLTNDQTSNVAGFETFLARGFTASLADLKLYERQEFLDLIAKPRPFTELAQTDLRIDLFGDVALVHGTVTFRMRDGVLGHARYTDAWQRQGGRWMCIGSNVTADNTAV